MKRTINLSMSVSPILVGRMLVHLGAFLADVGEIVGSVALLGKKPPDPKPGDQFEHYKKIYEVCSENEKCEIGHREYPHNPQVWCITSKCKEPCKCMLLRAEKADKEPKYEPDTDPHDDQNRYPYDPEKYWYFCVCVHEKKS
jgi:hypothetical protein